MSQQQCRISNSADKELKLPAGRYVPPHRRSNISKSSDYTSRLSQDSESNDKSTIPYNRRRDLSQGSKFNTRQISPKREPKRIPIEPELIKIPKMIIPVKVPYSPNDTPTISDIRNSQEYKEVKGQFDEWLHMYHTCVNVNLVV